jgi:Xaa-Pro dipeptidase
MVSTNIGGISHYIQENPMNSSNPVTLSYTSRQARLAEVMSKSGLECIALNPGPSLTYLTGLNFHLMERPVVTLFLCAGTPIIILPRLEAPKLEALSYKMRAFTYDEEPTEWPGVFQKAVQAAGINKSKVGVEPTRLRFLELTMLEQAAPKAQFLSAEASLSALRMFKDASEVAIMRKAVDIAQRGLQATLPAVKPGVTERELAAELMLQLLHAGGDPEAAFSPIVSGGPNSANPHASPTDRPLQNGDLLVIDWGASYKGYISDLTRTFAIGQIEPEFEQIARIVAEANAASRATAGPGVVAGLVDKAARALIEKAGYGAYFFTRVGHGIGMEVHEEPYIRAGNPLVLQPGMAFTIEPGIYLTGRNGVRVEDNVVITPTGIDCLSDLPRELRHIG